MSNMVPRERHDKMQASFIPSVSVASFRPHVHARNELPRLSKWTPSRPVRRSPHYLLPFSHWHMQSGGSRSGANEAVDPPVIEGKGMRRVSYSRILEQCAQALRDILSNESVRLVTLDFPPESSETRAGTLVSRYENNLNFMEKLLEALGCAEGTWRPVGGSLEIRNNVNPQGGGDYLTDDECMTGFSTACCPHLGSSGRSLILLINAGVDASTLGQVQKLDDGKSAVILLNCGLGRVSWFSKMSFATYIDKYEPAYYLKLVAGNGWLLKNGPNPWRTYLEVPTGLSLVSESETRPKLVDVEADIRIAHASFCQD